MLRTILVGLGMLALLVWVAPVSAQYTGSGGTYSHGMFGPRTLGQPVAPGQRHFGSGLRYGPAGEFLGRGRPGGEAMFRTPWTHSEPVPLPWMAQPVVVVPTEPVSVPLATQPNVYLPQPSVVQPPASIWFRSGAPRQ